MTLCITAQVKEELQAVIQTKDEEHQQYQAGVQGLIERLKRAAPHTAMEADRRRIGEQEAELRAVKQELARLRSQRRK